jgi:PHD/YefM family antitoxin component YafN of YafNO toxin-antitoxin module
MGSRRSEPEIVLRNGKPAAVIADIAQYEELLERAEDTYDLARLRVMRAKPLRYRNLDDFLSRRRRRV